MSRSFVVFLSPEELQFFKKILPPGHTLKSNNKEFKSKQNSQIQYNDKKEDKKGQLGPYKKCLRLLQILKQHEFSDPFIDPVDPIALGIPNYFEIIKNPMDLSLIDAKLKGNKYKSPFQFFRDIELIWKNAKTFNNEETDVYQMCVKLEQEYNKQKQKEFGEYLEDEKQLIDLLDKMSNIMEEDQKQNNKEITFKEKQQLLQDIKNLPLENQSGLQKIIQYGQPEFDFSIEQNIDLNQLNDDTIYRIYKYINRCKRLELQRNKKIKKKEIEQQKEQEIN